MPQPPNERSASLGERSAAKENNKLGREERVGRSPNALASQRRRLTVAALSHIQLALANAQAQANTFLEEDRAKIASAAHELARLAGTTYGIQAANSSEITLSVPPPLPTPSGAYSTNGSAGVATNLKNIGSTTGKKNRGAGSPASVTGGGILNTALSKTPQVGPDAAGGPTKTPQDGRAVIEAQDHSPIQQLYDDRSQEKKYDDDASGWSRPHHTAGSLPAQYEKEENLGEKFGEAEEQIKSELKHDLAKVGSMLHLRQKKTPTGYSPHHPVELRENMLNSGDKAELGEEANHLTELQIRLVDVFYQLDANRNGCLDRIEVEQAFAHWDMPKDSTTEFLEMFGERSYNKVDWLHFIGAFEDNAAADSVSRFGEALSVRQAKNGRIYTVQEVPLPCLIVKHDHSLRVCWDMMMLAALAYVAITLPLNIAMDLQNPFLSVLTACTDGLFIMDVIMNFRTTYVDAEDELVVRPRKIARKYLLTWFLFDFVSCVPWESITANMIPDLQAARIVKFGKLTRVIKMLRFSKVSNLAAHSHFVEDVVDWVQGSRFQGVITLLFMVTLLLVGSHWFACLLIYCRGPSLDSYQDVTDSPASKYLAGLYWAMMVMTTVGFGDIIPLNDTERIVTMVGIIVGGLYYSYIVASMTAIVGSSEVNKRAYNERLSMVQSWLNFHVEIPPPVRRRIRRHFKAILKRKTALEDSAIMNDLTPELNQDVAFFILHEDIRDNELFRDVNPIILTRLVPSVERLEYLDKESIAVHGAEGEGMFIIHHGEAELTAHGHYTKRLLQGDSFGEEILCGLENHYHYSVVALEDAKVFKLGVTAFLNGFGDHPHLVDELKKKCAQSANFTCMKTVRPKGHASLCSAPANIPSSFPEEVFSTLKGMRETMDSIAFNFNSQSSQDGMIRGVSNSNGGNNQQVIASDQWPVIGFNNQQV